MDNLKCFSPRKARALRALKKNDEPEKIPLSSSCQGCKKASNTRGFFINNGLGLYCCKSRAGERLTHHSEPGQVTQLLKHMGVISGS